MPDPVVFLLLGGFLLALGIERWGLHRPDRPHRRRARRRPSDRLPCSGSWWQPASLDVDLELRNSDVDGVPIGAAVIVSIRAVDEQERKLIAGDGSVTSLQEAVRT